MLAQDLDLPVSTLKVVDALVAKSDGIKQLLATVHSLLKAKPDPPREDRPAVHTPVHQRRPASLWDGRNAGAPTWVRSQPVRTMRHFRNKYGKAFAMERFVSDPSR